MGEVVFSTFIVAVSIAMLCSKLARSNGQDPRKWFLIGLLFNVFGLAVLFVVQSQCKKTRVRG